MKILFSSKCLEYRHPGHPESPERISGVYESLRNEFEFVKAKPCKEEDILRVHSFQMLQAVKNLEPWVFDPDTPPEDNIYFYASLAAGGAIQAAELALSGENSFSLLRPPGHHAIRTKAMGFCYFNNIAIACSKLLDSAEKTAILDLDCHHGNGTQDIFLGNPRILYVSLHQSPLYPGTGLTSQSNCINFPLPPGTTELQYLKILETGIKQTKKFNPDILGISMGFDTYKNDPLGGLALEEKSYKKISEIVFNLQIPCFSVLEGGYSKEMPVLIKNFLKP